MGRTLGPFTDVSTARVDGAYEIYEGVDDETRQVEILTLGASSSKDPARRALLSDTVAWARATRGPADAPILAADLNSDQPYVVTLRQTGFRGVERLLERMLAMGPPTGPLVLATGASTGQMPRITHHTDPNGIPVTATPPGSPSAPASPMTPYVTSPSKSSRPGWLMPLVIALVAIVALGGTAVMAFGFFDGADTMNNANEHTATAPEKTKTDEETTKPPAKPSLREGLEPVVLQGTPFSDSEAVTLVAEPGWPFAFRVPNGMTCETTGDALACLVADDQYAGMEVMIQLETCPGECDVNRQEDLRNAWNKGQQVAQFDDQTQYTETYGSDEFDVKLSRFFVPAEQTDRFDGSVHLTLDAKTPYGGEPYIWSIINDVLTQTQ